MGGTSLAESSRDNNRGENTSVSNKVSVTDNRSEAEKLRIIKEKKIAPATGRLLTDIAAEIWDHKQFLAGPGNRSGLTILQQPLKGPLYTSWYPLPASKNPHNPYKLTEKQERWKKKLKILRASGKGPPKKGAGKRSK